MDKKYSPRMRLYYWLILAFIVIFSFLAVASGMFILEHMGVIRKLSISTLVALLTVTLVSISLMSYFLGQRILTPMVKLSKASREVAKGNYNITVSDSSKLEEVQTTFRNFNAMVRQLDSVATLSNDFVANVSHEFKTPLTAIEGYAMLLQEPELTAQEREEYAEKILHNTHRLTSLVGNILTLSKIESAQLAPQYTHFRLDEQIRQSVVLLEPQWSAKRIDFDVQLYSVQMHSCESLLSHVWENLISNAIKFSHNGGCIELKLQEQKECVIVTVADHGCGIGQEELGHIFDKFYQADTSHRAQGYGLGLAMVKRIVELLDGLIEVESEKEKGTTFRVILPK
ncbi:MAG: HAMP domain-containing histidine kinase [Ruminococcaceae bacterium]|nr:HAMP domain-containing histidine kinase [Oscillospiraceae bacterium]